MVPAICKSINIAKGAECFQSAAEDHGIWRQSVPKLSATKSILMARALGVFSKWQMPKYPAYAPSQNPKKSAAAISPSRADHLDQPAVEFLP
jgi:hypothetical protein